MLCVLLAINHGDMLSTTKGDKRCEGNFGGIGAIRKHGFTKHHRTQIHAIKPPCKLSVYPGLHAMGMAGLVQCGVCIDH